MTGHKEDAQEEALCPLALQQNQHMVKATLLLLQEHLSRP